MPTVTTKNSFQRLLESVEVRFYRDGKVKGSGTAVRFYEEPTESRATVDDAHGNNKEQASRDARQDEHSGERIT